MPHKGFRGKILTGGWEGFEYYHSIVWPRRSLAETINYPPTVLLP